jgi:hypothetical protein
MSCRLGRQRSWPASRALSRQPAASLTGSPQVRYLRPVIVTVTDSLAARGKREREQRTNRAIDLESIAIEGLVGIEPTSRCLTDSRTNHCATDPNAGALLHQQLSRGRAFASSVVVHYARAKSAMTGGVDASKPTTSSIPASLGSAMLKPVDVIPTTTSLAGTPRASR